VFEVAPPLRAAHTGLKPGSTSKLRRYPAERNIPDDTGAVV